MMPTKDPEEGMTYVEKLDFRAQAHQHEMERAEVAERGMTERAKYNHREARQETLRWIGVSLVAALVVLGIVAAIVYGVTRPNTGADEEERREIACVAKGGGWVPRGMLNDEADDSGLCVFPGDR